jgi:hypothetical protein
MPYHPIPCRTAPPAALPISHASPSSLERAPESCRAPLLSSQLRYATYPPYQSSPGSRIDSVFRLSRLPLVPFWPFCSFLADHHPPLLGASQSDAPRPAAGCLLSCLLACPCNAVAVGRVRHGAGDAVQSVSGLELLCIAPAAAGLRERLPSSAVAG